MTTTPKIRTSNYFTSAIAIDGVSIDLRIKRLNVRECDAVQTGLDRLTAGARGSDVETEDVREARAAEADAWIRGVLRDYVLIMPGQIEHEGREVTDASEMVDIYGGRLDIVPQLVALVLGENRLSESEKKTFRLAFASAPGSATELPLTAPGGAPVPIAAAAEPRASVLAAAVTAVRSAASSGTTGPSSSAPARPSRSRRRSKARSAGSTPRMGS